MFGRLRKFIFVHTNRGILSRPAFWDSRVTDFTGDAPSMWSNKHLNRYYELEQKTTLDKLLNADLTGKKCLDAGCGTGRIARFLAAKGADVHAIDFSGRAIERARKCDNSGRVQYQEKSIYDLEPGVLYDLIVNVSVLAVACRDSRDLERIATSIHELLAVGGQWIIMEPIHNSRFLYRVLRMKQSDFCNVLEAARFKIVHKSNLHFFPVRFMLAFFNLPSSITYCMYKFGQFLMNRVFINLWGGDYLCLSLTKSSANQQVATRSPLRLIS